MVIHPLVFKLHKSLRAFLGGDQHYLLAVSGGSDSMALAAACAALQREGWGRYSVCHVEHGLRGEESLRDMRVVKDFCDEQGLACYVRHVNVRPYAEEEHLSIETAARNLRHAALNDVMTEIEAYDILFAHNKDDQAETVLMRLLRGSSLTGLGGIRPDGYIGLHPLLEFTHGQLQEYCRLQSVPYCHDSTNDDLVYMRNRIRHELLPYLERHFNSNIKETLARTAKQLQVEDEYLDEEALHAYAQARVDTDRKIFFVNDGEKTDPFDTPPPNKIAVWAEALQNQSVAMRRRVLREIHFGMTLIELDYERTLALEQLLMNGVGGKVIQLPGGVTARYHKQQIIFEKK